MIKIKAKIYTHTGKGRNLPLKSGYRPLFEFGIESKKSGMITLIDSDYIEIGRHAEVYITFNDDKNIENYIEIGRKVSFGEGFDAFGEAEVTEIVER